MRALWSRILGTTYCVATCDLINSEGVELEERSSSNELNNRPYLHFSLNHLLGPRLVL